MLVLALAGCGYHLAGEGSALPDDIHSLGVGTITNRCREHGLEKTLAFALEQEIQVRRHFRMEEDPGGADAVLSGTIRDLIARPIAFDTNDRAVQYELTLVLDLTLTRQSDGHTLWHVKGLRESGEFAATAQVEVTASSQFQRGTLNPQDVNNPQFTSIQLAETEHQRALTRLLRQAVRDAYNQMVENF
jgi:outer membrane lipopolysaccharide assembly protein LptE/RlpB